MLTTDTPEEGVTGRALRQGFLRTLLRAGFSGVLIYTVGMAAFFLKGNLRQVVPGDRRFEVFVDYYVARWPYCLFLVIAFAIWDLWFRRTRDAGRGY